MAQSACEQVTARISDEGGEFNGREGRITLNLRAFRSLFMVKRYLHTAGGAPCKDAVLQPPLFG